MSDEASELRLAPPASVPRRRAWRWLFALSGAIALLALFGSSPDPTPLIYAAFVALWFARPLLPRTHGRPSPARFAIALIGSGLALEVLAWLSNFLKCSPAPAMMHPQLAPDLLLGLGFYGAWAAAWLLLLRRYTFTAGQLFVTQGIFGVLVEQQGAIFVAGLATLPAGLLLWLYVFAVYGSVAGIAALIAGVPGDGARAGRWRFPLALLLMAVIAWPVLLLWSGMAQGVGLLPAHAPICERPLW
jgi:hypothetical protein